MDRQSQRHIAAVIREELLLANPTPRTNYTLDHLVWLADEALLALAEDEK